MNSRMQCGLNNWRKMSFVLCKKMIPPCVKGKIHKDITERCRKAKQKWFGHSASSRIRFLPVHPARSCRAVVAPRGRRTARSSNWAILLFSDIKFNNIIITTNNYIYLLKSNSVMLQVIVHNKNNSEN